MTSRDPSEEISIVPQRWIRTSVMAVPVPVEICLVVLSLRRVVPRLLLLQDYRGGKLFT
jgi:hypothetical protein